MESYSQRQVLLEQEIGKVTKWETAESLLNTFEETMLQLKTSNPGLSQDDVHLVIKGMIRAVNDLKYASELILRGKKPEFQENDNEEPLVSKARSATRFNLIADYKQRIRGLKGGEKKQILEAPKVLENYIRLNGTKHLINIYEMLTPELVKERKRNNSGWMVYSLYNFNAWEDQRNRPQEREFNRRQNDFEKIRQGTEDVLTGTLFKFIDEIQKELKDDIPSDPDLIQGIEHAVIDLRMRSSMGIVWNELIGKPPHSGDVELMNRRFEGKDFGPRLSKKAEEIRVNLRRKLFKSFSENIERLREGHIIRYGSRDDLEDFYKGLAHGVNDFCLKLEDVQYAQKLYDSGLLSDVDFLTIKEFIEYFRKEGYKSTKFIGSDGRHNRAIGAVVLEGIHDLDGYKGFLGIKG